VETPAILEMLRSMGQLKGQGYLYGQPEDSTTTRERLKNLNLLAGESPAPAAETDRERRAG